MSIDQHALRRLIEDELARSVAPEIHALAGAIRRGRSGIAAILFYGAGLWKAPDDDTVFDFYVLVDGYVAFDARRVVAALGRVLPPNVYYLENGGRRCKYAVIRLDQFDAGAAGRARHSQIWARFAQPARLVYARDDAARGFVVRALSAATVTFHAQTLPLCSERPSPREIWVQGLGRTYGNEWRSEDGSRAAAIYEASRDALEARSRIVLPDCAPAGRVVTRGARRGLAKTLYFLQMIKAVFTFEGGVEYALWKIERQSGVRLEASAFQKRHPLVAAWPLVWRAWRRGALR